MLPRLLKADGYLPHTTTYWDAAMPMLLALCIVFYLQLVMLVRSIVHDRSPRLGQLFTGFLFNCGFLFSVTLQCWRLESQPTVPTPDIVIPIYIIILFGILFAQDPTLPNRR